MADDNIQHGIDDNPEGDATKGGVLGAVGGAIVGGLAGGPVGAIIGAVAGGVTSAAGVAAIDRVDNDDTVSGLGDSATRDPDATDDAGATSSGTGGFSATNTGNAGGFSATDTGGFSATPAASSGGFSATPGASTIGSAGSAGDDNIQHGIDDNPQGDTAKGAGLGAIGGAGVGFAAGGPLGAAVGAVAGGLGAGGATAAVDRVDNDDTVTGLGSGATRDVNAGDDTITTRDVGTSNYAGSYDAGTTGTTGGVSSGGMSGSNAAGDNIQHGIDDNPHDDAAKGAGLGALGGAAVGFAAGGPVGAAVGAVAGGLGGGGATAAVDRVDNDNTVTGLGDGATRKDDDTSDGTYASTGAGGTFGTGADLTPGNDVPGIQTGGRNADGSPDTRGITEKASDTLTGDRTDDKTGRTI